MKKSRKIPWVDFLQNLKNLTFGPLWAHFGPTTPEQDFFPENQAMSL